MHTRTLFIALLAALAGLVPAAAHAGAWLPARGEYYSEFSAARAFTDTYYDTLGTRYSLPSSQRVEGRGLFLYNEFGWRKYVSIILSAPILSVTDSWPDFHYARTETGFGDLNLGFRLKLLDGATALAAQTDVIAPLGYQTNTFPALGSGRQAIGEQLVFGTAIKPLNMFVEAAASYYWIDLARDQAATNARVGWWLGPSLLVTGKCERVIQQKEQPGFVDYFTTFLTAPDMPLTEKFEFVSVSPEIRYRVDDRLDVFVGSTHDWTGTNALHLDQFYIGMAFRQTKLNRLQGLLGNKTQP